MEEIIMAQYALDRVISVAGTYAATNEKKGITEGGLAFLCDQVVDPSLSFTSETEDIVDARNNVVMQLQGARGATFGASNAFFNTQILANQTGGKVEAITSETFDKYDICTVKEGTDGSFYVELSATPDTDSKFNVFKLRSDNSITTADPVKGEYTAGSAGKPGKVTFTTTAVDADEDGYSDRVLVAYTAKVEAGEKIVALADAQNELMNITAEVLLRELCKEELYYAYVIMRGKLSGEAEWSMSRDGNHAFEITAVPEYCSADKKLVEVIIVKGNDLL
jgi:hypothetical protein